MAKKYKIDHAGEKHGLLTILKFDRRDLHNQYWVCKCECGNIKSMAYGAIIKATKKGQPVGCGCRKNRPRCESSRWKGHGEISHQLWWFIKNSSKNRHLPFDITIEYIWDLFLKQDRKCALSGVNLTFNSKATIKDGNASLDRIDSSKGYIKGNVQWVHKRVNKMKSNYSEKELIYWCNLIADKVKNDML